MATSKRMQKTIGVVGTKFPWMGSALNVERVIRFVLEAWRRTAPRKDPERYDDARDIMNWADLLKPLSVVNLRKIISMKRSEAKRTARHRFHPFNELEERHQGLFATQLSGREIIKVARYRLDVLEGRE